MITKERIKAIENMLMTSSNGYVPIILELIDSFKELDTLLLYSNVDYEPTIEGGKYISKRYHDGRHYIGLGDSIVEAAQNSLLNLRSEKWEY